MGTELTYPGVDGEPHSQELTGMDDKLPVIGKDTRRKIDSAKFRRTLVELCEDGGGEGPWEGRGWGRQYLVLDSWSNRQSFRPRSMMMPVDNLPSPPCVNLKISELVSELSGG